MKSKKYLVILCLVWYSSVLAKNPFDWNPGILVTENEEIINGEISFHFEQNLVCVRKNGRIKTYTPHKTRFFRYYDQSENMHHRFMAFDLSRQKNRKYHMQFFEIVFKGSAVVLRKPIDDNSGGFLVDIPFSIRSQPSRGAKNYDYYVHIGGNIFNFKNFKKSILPLLNESHKKEIDEFIEEKNLNYQHIGDQFLIVDYFNSLQDTSYVPLDIE